MTKVNIDISISLDGFITGPNPRPGEGLGDGGAALHEWAFKLRSFQEQHGREGGETGRDDDVLAEGFSKAGAFLMGRSMFDLAEEPWGESPPFHAPVFVLTHEQREPLPKQGGTTFTFVSDGIESALTQARQAAGDKDVAIAGGASVIRQCLAAGVVDEMQIHVTPLLLGSGTLLFDESTAGVSLEPTRSIEGDGVTHLRYRVGDRG
jgi:dihydrofolate reductase